MNGELILRVKMNKQFEIRSQTKFAVNQGEPVGVIVIAMAAAEHLMLIVDCWPGVVV